MAPLVDAFRKLERADEHLRILETDMREKLDAKEYTVTREAKTEVTEASSVTLMGPMQLVDPPDLPLEWALLIGDFAYNARAALDHLAWQLALSNQRGASRTKARKAGKPWPPENTEFPIFVRLANPSDKARLKTKLNYFRELDRKLVAAEQPYKRRKLAHAQTLWLLHRLRNDDAHRTFHTVLASVPLSLAREFHYGVRAVTGGGAEVQLPEKFEVFRMPGLVEFPLKPGDVLKTRLQVKADFSPYVAFDQRGADYHGQEVLPLLHRCRDEVERVLRLF